MADLDLTTQRVVLTKISTPLKPGAIVKPQVLLTSLLSALGFSSVIIGATAPGDQEALWYNKDTNTFRRYNPLTSTWAVMVPAQWVMHLFQMGMKAATVEGIVDSADKHLFFDVSANEIKTISDADYKLSLGLSGWMQYGPTVTLAANSNQVEFDLPASYSDFLVFGNWTSTGSGTRSVPILSGVYPSSGVVDFGPDATSDGTFTAGSAQVARWWGSGDRGDLTGVLYHHEIRMDRSAGSPRCYPVSDRIAKVRYRRAYNDYQFASGSIFKLFVR